MLSLPRERYFSRHCLTPKVLFSKLLTSMSDNSVRSVAAALFTEPMGKIHHNCDVPGSQPIGSESVTFAAGLSPG